VRAGTQIVKNGNANIQGAQVQNSPSGLTPMPTPSTYVDLGDLTINGNANYSFAAGDYLVNTLNVNGNPTINVSGTVRIWFRSLNLAGNVGAGASTPSQLQFYSRVDAQQANLNGTCKLTGVIFAPNIVINHSGNNGVYGALVGASVTLNGNVAVHYDEDLGSACSAGGVSLARVGDPKVDFSTAWLPEGKPLIAVPNPSKGESLAVFKLPQSGDVTLTLLNIAGERALRIQSHGLSAGENNLPLDLSHVAPGVYILVLEGPSDFGPKVLAQFKMAVVP
jgi:hypothetical protein